MDKTELRNQFKARRAGIAGSQRRHEEKLVAGHLQKVVEKNAGPSDIIASYRPIGTEFCPPFPFNHSGFQNYNWALPAVLQQNTPLIFRRWTQSTSLDQGMYGIEEPDKNEPECLPNLIITPLLAYDSHGYRLGYGGGYYDRTLSSLRQSSKVLAIGLAFKNLQMDNLPIDENDEKLDLIITADGQYLFEH